jgi:uncharacterized membrane protein
MPGILNASVVNAPIDGDGFRPRGTAMSRIDALSDVVFGFAITLLVVSLEVPKTYSELHAMLKGFVPFALCFGVLMMVWIRHYRFFRRFGLHDAATIWINAVLLFVVLFYVYPLKFLFTLAVGGAGERTFSAPTQIRELMVFYGAGVCSVYGLIALLNYQGWRQRRALELTRHEQMLTRSYIGEACITAAIGALSCGVAWALPLSRAEDAGWTYLLVVVHKPIHAVLVHRRGRRLREAPDGPNA